MDNSRHVYITNNKVNHKDIHKIILYSFEDDGTIIIKEAYTYDKLKDFKEDYEFRNKFLGRAACYSVAYYENTPYHNNVWQYAENEDFNKAVNVYIDSLSKYIDKWSRIVNKSIAKRENIINKNNIKIEDNGGNDNE